MLFVVHSIVFSKLKYKILHGFAWVHLTWKRCILNGLTGSCKICSIFMPRLGMNLARLCAKSCQNVMGSHGKSWQDLANFFLRGMMSAHEVDKEKWAFKLAPNLSGKAQLAYAAMDSDDAKDLRASQGDDFATLQHQYRDVSTTLSDHQKARRLVIQGPNCETAGPFAEMD